MSHRKIVVALGGNAILSTDPSAQAQQAALVETARHLVKLIQNGDELIITHGNGPQVGNLLLQHLIANSEKIYLSYRIKSIRKPRLFRPNEEQFMIEMELLLLRMQRLIMFMLSSTKLINQQKVKFYTLKKANTTK